MDSLNAESLFVNRHHPIESLDGQYGLTEVKQRNLRNPNATFFAARMQRNSRLTSFSMEPVFKGYFKVTHCLFFLREGLI